MKKSANPTFKICIFLILAIFTVSFSACSFSVQRYEETREKMGTFVNIVIYAGENDYMEILDSSYAVIDEQSKILSNYDPDSSISVLNREGVINNAPDELVEIINLSKEYNKITGGAFDITVEPVLKLWSEGLWQESKEMQEQKITEALELIGSGMIDVKGNTISFAKKGMEATLGGIAKGYIVDKITVYLKNHGIKNALVNAGGDIATIGSKPDGEKWIINLENPDNLEEKIASFEVSGEAIATSGNYYRYYDPKKEVHHIIDPRSGYSADQCISATIIAKNATVADILATSVFVLGPDDGINLAEALDEVEAFIIGNDRSIYKTSGIDKYLIN